MDPEQGSLRLEQTLELLRRRGRLIALCFVLACAAAYLYSKHETKRYTATAALLFNNEGLDQQAAGLPVVSSNDQPAQQNTNLKLVQLGDTAANTAHELGHGMTKQQVSESVSVSAPGESNIVDVAATADSPVLAAMIADTYVRQFVKEQQQSSFAYYASALKLVKNELSALSPAEQASTTGRVLQEREQSLQILAQLPAGARVAQPASVPSSPSSPSVMRNTIVGALLGLMIGLGSAALLERLDLRIRDPKDLEALYGLPLLGVVPAGAVTPASPRGKGEYIASSPGAVEAFRLIRARLRYFNVDHELKTLLVASGSSGDGKTTVALNLARAAALIDSRVLLIELDLRRPCIAGRLGLPAGPGLSDALIGAVSTEEVTHTVDLGSTAVRAGRRSLDVIVAGAMPPPNAGLLIESNAMNALLQQVKEQYELVIIDTPELNNVSDAFPLLCKVDGVIIVGHAGGNRRDALALHETLLATKAPLLGVVANGFDAARPNPYGYGFSPVPHVQRPARVSLNRASSTGAAPIAN